MILLLPSTHYSQLPAVTLSPAAHVGVMPTLCLEHLRSKIIIEPTNNNPTFAILLNETHCRNQKPWWIDDDDDDDWVEGGRWKVGMLLKEGFEFFRHEPTCLNGRFKTAYSVWLLRISQGDYHWYFSTCLFSNYLPKPRYSTLISHSLPFTISAFSVTRGL